MNRLSQSNFMKKYGFPSSDPQEEKKWNVDNKKNESMTYVMLRQEHHTEFPIQMSSTYHPRGNKIIIANL